MQRKHASLALLSLALLALTAVLPACETGGFEHVLDVDSSSEQQPAKPR